MEPINIQKVIDELAVILSRLGCFKDVPLGKVLVSNVFGLITFSN